MSLKDLVSEILIEKERSLNWLAENIGRTGDGLRVGLNRESVKYKDLVAMAEKLQISPSRFFKPTAQDLNPQQNVVSETTVEYGRLKGCEELVTALRNQINDKERIITLLSKGKIDAM